MDNLWDCGVRAFRFKLGDERCCTLHENGVVWLLAVAQRRADSVLQDAYSRFLALQQAGELLPTEADWQAANIEILLYVEVPNAVQEGLVAVEASLRQPGIPFASESQAGPIEVVAVVEIDEDYSIAEITIAFYHSAAATALGRDAFHAHMLNQMSRSNALLPPAEGWDVWWAMKLDQSATGMYHTTIESE